MRRQLETAVRLISPYGAAIALMLALLAPQAAVAAGGGAPTDRQITVAVDSMLMRDDAVLANYIDVSTSDGVVTLSGHVPHLLARERAVDIARSTEGVLSVIDSLEVDPVSRSDDDIAKDVRRAFAYEPALAIEDVEIDVHDAAVTVSGRAGSFQQKMIAERTVFGVRGVRKVHNRVEVAPKAHRQGRLIREDIESRLKGDIWVDASYIEVDVIDGGVFLAGRVGSAAERQRAWADAAVAGVRSIDASGLSVDPSLLAPQKKPEKTPLSDKEIAAVLKRTYRQDPRISADKVTVEVDAGVVLLTGEVSTLRARSIATEDARNTTGVALVKNLLKVRPRIGSRFVPPPSYDAQLAQELRYALLRDPYVNQHQIGVSVQDSIVRLSGTVDSWFEKNRAQEVAGRKEGVILVKNQIDVGVDRPQKDDEAVRRAVIEEMVWSPFVDENNVVVVVDDGTAVLSGKADTLRERRAATKNAYDAGARRVVNRLTVEHPRMPSPP